MKKITKAQYQEYVKEREPKSNMPKNLCMAFLFGGLICAAGQGLSDMYAAFGLTSDQAAAATSITMIFLGAFLTALNVYDKIANIAGAGTLVPITGFANSIVSPAMEFKSEGIILGMSARMFTIAGPVLVFGVSVSVLYGITRAALGI